MSDDRNGVNAEPEKIEPENLPDLTRLFKNRARNVDVMRKCKILLIAGYSPQRVSLVLRLPLDRVMELFENSYNPRCRRFAKNNAYSNAQVAVISFNEGAKLAEICQTLGLPLFTVVQMLRQNSVTDAEMAPKIPPYDDSLSVEYRQVVARKAACKQKTIQISPPRRVRKAAGTTATD